MASYETIFGVTLFTLEFYHILTHLAILFRVRMLPRQDLVRQQWYFIIDLGTAFCSSFLYLQKFQLLTSVQFIQHLYYIIFWNQTNPAKKIISWSSLDWMKSDFSKDWNLDCILGTAFDASVHILMAYYLSAHLSLFQILLSISLCVSSFYFLIFNSEKFAWRDPNETEHPTWINKRIKPVAEEDAKLF
ncbi:unnamed protein product [Meganyctiphanes norvegica]|uniref:Vomeronasal type-1 receptor n=1 Tax=Meganyctiphanes norvegica TaxID=48144 RepID=A0AAV2RAT3_MEGNR